MRAEVCRVEKKNKKLWVAAWLVVCATSVAVAHAEELQDEKLEREIPDHLYLADQAIV
ncbi:hypothetical protein ACFS07_24830 [Undibacterium arcticum]